jgi:Uma2 family endonuclease
MMEPAQSSTKLTYADYVRLPDDGKRHEIIDGVHYVSPSPVTRHQRILLRLAHVLAAYLDEHPVGEVFIAPFDILLSDFDIVVPDLIYLSKQHAHFLTEKNLQGPSDLVVEILSPGTRRRDEGLKRDLYERVGVREYWLVDPKANVVRVYRRGKSGFKLPQTLSAAAGDLLTTTLLPGFQVSLTQLLA